MATDFALKRARFEMNCPEATATVLAKQTIVPPMAASRFGAVEHDEFTIGVAGCGKRETLVVLRADASDGCFAGEVIRRPIQSAGCDSGCTKPLSGSAATHHMKV